MNGAAAATVTRVTQDQTLDATGKVISYMRVSYMVGDHGPFMVSIPADQFSADVARAMMQPTVDAVNALTATA